VLAVNDIQIHPREGDVILATHGRGIYILDDATALRELPAALATDFTAFDVRPATRWQTRGRDASPGHRTYEAANPPQGAAIHYYLKADLPEKEQVTITVADGAGKTVAEVRNAPKAAGLNRAVWNLRYSPPRAAGERGTEPGGAGPGAVPGGAEAAEGGGPGGRFGFRAGPPVLPGDYTVTVKAAGKEARKAVHVELDPRVRIADADLQSQHQALMSLRDLTSELNGVVDRTENLTKQLTALSDGLKPRGRAESAGGAAGPSSPAEAAVTRALDRLKGLRDKLTRPAQGLMYRTPPRLREELGSLSGAIGGPIAPPTEPQKLRLEELKQETAAVAAELEEILGKEIAEVNELLKDRPQVAVTPAR
jgi:hypothetical protein